MIELVKRKTTIIHLRCMAHACRANQINPEAYLVKMLSQIRACKTQDDFKKLLPYHVEF